jgi:hypothetical protein
MSFQSVGPPAKTVTQHFIVFRNEDNFPPAVLDQNTPIELQLERSVSISYIPFQHFCENVGQRIS